MFWHSQNLNDKAHGKQGTVLRHGRARFEWGWLDISWEWCHFMKSSPGFAISKSDGGALRLTLSILFAQWFLRIGGLFPTSACDREISVRAHDGNVWLRWWGDPDDSSRDHQLVLRISEWVLGRATYRCEPLGSVETFIPMREGCYPATIVMERATWTRKRWFTKTLVRAKVDVPKGIPFMGKGENSWDQGDDGLFGMTCPAKNVNAAIAKVVESVLESRRRHGETSETQGKTVLARPAPETQEATPEYIGNQLMTWVTQLSRRYSKLRWGVARRVDDKRNATAYSIIKFTQGTPDNPVNWSAIEATFYVLLNTIVTKKDIDPMIVEAVTSLIRDL